MNLFANHVVINNKVWGSGVQWHNDNTKFRENRLYGSKSETRHTHTHTHTQHADFIRLFFSLSKENGLKWNKEDKQSEGEKKNKGIKQQARNQVKRKKTGRH
jgi:hypothetical protein